MDTRGENNKSRESRTSKNKQLYNNLYNDTNYSNMVVIDDSNEIDINKIKEDNFIEIIKNYFVANNIEFENKTNYTNSEIKEMYIKYIDLISTELVENIRYVDQMYKKDLFSDSTAYNKFINNIAKLNNW